MKKTHFGIDGQEVLVELGNAGGWQGTSSLAGNSG